jgi:hypothetical protein
MSPVFFSSDQYFGLKNRFLIITFVFTAGNPAKSRFPTHALDHFNNHLDPPSDRFYQPSGGAGCDPHAWDEKQGSLFLDDASCFLVVHVTGF